MHSRHCLRLPASLSALVLGMLSAHVTRADLSWIWATGEGSDERASLRRTFEVPADVREAVLVVTSDNGARVFLNDQPVLSNSDWNEPSRANVVRQLTPGRNVLRAEARNAGGKYGFVARLRLKTADGKETVLETDGSWEARVRGQESWQPARVLARYGSEPWGDALAGADVTSPPPVLAPSEIQTLPGFTVELVHAVPKWDQGSWVSLTVDPKGRLLACDQGGGLYRLTLPPAGSGTPAVVEALTNRVGGAHGLLHAFDSLYVMVNEQGGRQGLWRLRDTDGDDQYDQEELLRRLEGGGEHGPHAVVLSPDGQSLYITAGNHTKLPVPLEESRGPRNWAEDQIVPRLWDANGHARGVMAPGGYICRTDPDGRTFELVSHGFRNEYDIAFNALGDLFTYDSDMEWDAGLPWYRPTRINLATSGSEFGWRSGAGKWPAYYPDSLPALVDIGPGSPTGVASGQGARFPARYQNAIYANDWTYGTMYAIHLTPDGAGYRAEKEEFLSGRPLPLTDMVVHPGDGALYFAVGGRRTQSAVYRVRYTGPENTDPAPAPIAPPAMQLRRRLESLHQPGTTPAAIAEAWPHLAHPDRWVRFAARTAIERQPVDAWAERAQTESRPLARIEAAVALARQGRPEHRDGVLARLNELDFSRLDPAARLAAVRAYQLAVLRLGLPEGATREATLTRLHALYPAGPFDLNRELAGLLVALDSPVVVPRTVPLMLTANDSEVRYASDALLGRNRGYGGAFAKTAASRPNQQQIAFAYLLRTARSGWNPALRRAFFAWFPSTAAWEGGNSFRGFIEQIRRDALATETDDTLRSEWDALSTRVAETAGTGTADGPKGPGQVYTLDTAVSLVGDGLRGRSFDTGRALYTSIGCAACHRFAGSGGGLGPDLTGAASRYTLRDLMENIIEPSRVISDQYGTDEVTLTDGSTLVGRAYEEDGQLVVLADPRNPDDATRVPLAQVKGRQPYPVSLMPSGLINSLNPDELRDLVAYLQSGGDPAAPVYSK